MLKIHILSGSHVYLSFDIVSRHKNWNMREITWYTSSILHWTVRWDNIYTAQYRAHIVSIESKMLCVHVSCCKRIHKRAFRIHAQWHTNTTVPTIAAVIAVGLCQCYHTKINDTLHLTNKLLFRVAFNRMPIIFTIYLQLNRETRYFNRKKFCRSL